MSKTNSTSPENLQDKNSKKKSSKAGLAAAGLGALTGATIAEGITSEEDENLTAELQEAEPLAINHEEVKIEDAVPASEDSNSKETEHQEEEPAKVFASKKPKLSKPRESHQEPRTSAEEIHPQNLHPGEDVNLTESDLEIVSIAEEDEIQLPSDGASNVNLSSAESIPEVEEIEEVIEDGGVITIDEIDPNDINPADQFNYEKVEHVYAVDGQSHLAATFRDASGNHLMMVDIDNDNVFDIITDIDGKPLVNNNGNWIGTGGITRDDAELGIDPKVSYLARNDSDDTDDFGEDTIFQDIIS